MAVLIKNRTKKLVCRFIHFLLLCQGIYGSESNGAGPPKNPQECIAYFVPGMNPGFGTEKDVDENAINDACKVESTNESIEDCKLDLKKAQTRYHKAAARREKTCHEMAWFYATCQKNVECYKSYRAEAQKVAKLLLEEANDLRVMSKQLRRASEAMGDNAKKNWDYLTQKQQKDIEIACKISNCKNTLLGGTANELKAMKKPDSGISSNPSNQNASAARAKLIDKAIGLPGTFLAGQQIVAALLSANKNDKMVDGIKNREEQAKALSGNVEVAGNFEKNLSSLRNGAPPFLQTTSANNFGSEKNGLAKEDPSHKKLTANTKKTNELQGSGKGFTNHGSLGSDISDVVEASSGISMNTQNLGQKFSHSKDDSKGRAIQDLLGQAGLKSAASKIGNTEEVKNGTGNEKDYSLKQKLLDQLAEKNRSDSHDGVNSDGGARNSQEQTTAFDAQKLRKFEEEQNSVETRGLASAEEANVFAAREPHLELGVGSMNGLSLFERISLRCHRCSDIDCVMPKR